MSVSIQEYALKIFHWRAGLLKAFTLKRVSSQKFLPEVKHVSLKPRASLKLSSVILLERWFIVEYSKKAFSPRELAYQMSFKECVTVSGYLYLWRGKKRVFYVRLLRYDSSLYDFHVSPLTILLPLQPLPMVTVSNSLEGSASLLFVRAR